MNNGEEVATEAEGFCDKTGFTEDDGANAKAPRGDDTIAISARAANFVMMK